MHGHAVHRLGGFDLAAKARGFRPLRGHGQHLFFSVADRSGLAEPLIRNDHVAGAAGALPATIPVDAWDGVIGGNLHQRGASLKLCDMFSVVMLNKRDLAQFLSPANNLCSDSDSTPV